MHASFANVLNMSENFQKLIYYGTEGVDIKVTPFIEVLPAAFQVQAVYRAMRRDNRMKYFL